MNDNCIFCKIIGKEIPSTTLYEDEDFCVIMDISPASKGHAILLVKEHVPNIYELNEDIASKAFIVVSKVAKAMKEELKCDGLNILQNNGEAAGQTVFHLHIHLIPRYNDDQVNITWNPGKYGEGEAATIADAIRKRL